MIDVEKIIEAMELAGDSSEAYYNMDNGDIEWLGDFMDSNESEELIERIEEGNYIRLPSKFDINEYRIMEEFIESLPGGEAQNRLLRAIKGKGAFRRFKDTVNFFGIADAWYSYRDEAYKNIAVKWCESNNLLQKETGYDIPDRPYIICHMVTSIDGKVTGSFLSRPECSAATEIYYKINREYKADAFACGRVTMEESFTNGFVPELVNRSSIDVGREDYIADYTAEYYAVAFDRYGKLGWRDSRIYDNDPGYNNAHIIEVLCEKTPNENLAYFREKGISYIFAGKEDIDISTALKKLKEQFGINKLLLEGGSILNGAFAKNNLIDELSLVVTPMVADDESKPLFNKANVSDYILKDKKIYDDSVLWLNFKNKSSSI